MCSPTVTDLLSFVNAFGTLAAAVAGFSAVWVALKTHRESQARMRLATRPMVDFVTDFGAQGIRVALHNVGQGVAVIKSPIYANFRDETRRQNRHRARSRTHRR